MGVGWGETVETWPASRSFASGMTRPAIPTDWLSWETQQTGAAPSGRWPANLIHDGSDEVVGLFPETTSGKPMNKMHTDPGRNVASGASEGGEYFHTGYGPLLRLRPPASFIRPNARKKIVPTKGCQKALRLHIRR
jgi:hypothetical protein